MIFVDFCKAGRMVLFIVWYLREISKSGWADDKIVEKSPLVLANKVQFMSKQLTFSSRGETSRMQRERNTLDLCPYFNTPPGLMHFC